MSETKEITFKELLRRNAEWWATKGSLKEDHWSLDGEGGYDRDEILKESPSFDLLPEINKFVITIDSQDGKYTKPKRISEESTVFKNETKQERSKLLIKYFKDILPKKYADRIDEDTVTFSQQRPYLQFWADEEMYNRVMKYLYDQPDLLVIIHDKDGEKSNAPCQEQKEKHKFPSGKVDWAIPLTSEIIRTTDDNNLVEDYHHNSANCPLVCKSVHCFDLDIRQGINIDRLFMIEILANKFCAKGKPFLRRILDALGGVPPP